MTLISFFEISLFSFTPKMILYIFSDVTREHLKYGHFPSTSGTSFRYLGRKGLFTLFLFFQIKMSILFWLSAGHSCILSIFTIIYNSCKNCYKLYYNKVIIPTKIHVIKSQLIRTTCRHVNLPESYWDYVNASGHVISFFHVKLPVA